MKILIAVITAGLLAACAAPVPMAGSGDSGLIVAGTLANANNPTEMALASIYSRLVVLRKRTANALRSGRLPVSEAERIQKLADEARALADAGQPQKAAEAVLKAEVYYDNVR